MFLPPTERNELKPMCLNSREVIFHDETSGQRRASNEYSVFVKPD